ncbi:ASCH domain-containing protein [Micromonospora sp. KC606]|nr:ASCH domain-containing protein [Micromonospora sp. KC606]
MIPDERSTAQAALVEAARSLLRTHGDGNIHTVAAAVLDEHGRAHVGLNLYHFTGGPCAELVALAAARAAGARAPRLIVAVGDAGRGVLAPCGRDRQVLADHFPDIHVIVPSGEGTQVVHIGDLLPHTYWWQAQQLQRLRFRASHLPAVRDGSKRVTMRLRDPVQVGPALLVFEFDDEVSMPGRITSTVARSVDSITDDEAQEDGFTSAADVLHGLRDYYPELRASDEIVIVRFEVTDS